MARCHALNCASKRRKIQTKLLINTESDLEVITTNERLEASDCERLDWLAHIEELGSSGALADIVVVDSYEAPKQC